MDEFLRARKPEEKEERRAHLLATARAMLGGGGDVADVSLSEIARRAGMAKSNVYRYFETREALQLALVWDEWAAWYGALIAGYRKPGRGHRALDALLKQVAQSLAARPLLCALTAALPSVVERNLSDATVYDFKVRSLEFFGETAEFFERCAPEVSAQAYAGLIHDTVALIAGLHAFSNPAPSVARALKSPELKSFRRDFASDLERMLLALAHALPKRV